MFYVFTTTKNETNVINERDVRRIRINDDDSVTLYLSTGQATNGCLHGASGTLSESMNFAIRIKERGGL